MKKVANIEFRNYMKTLAILSIICTIILSGCTGKGQKDVDNTKLVELQPEIKITYTKNTVDITENITGSAKNITNGSEVWIVIHPHTVNKYYPQNKVGIQNETWSLPVNIGSENDTGTEFDIIAVLADEKAQGEFNNYFKTCKETEKWPGMDKIPDNAKECDNVTVIRNSTVNPEIRIAYNSTTARMEEYITGTAKNVTNGSEVWIVVHPHTVNKFYPQNKVEIQNEIWGLLVGIGSENDTGTRFDVIAVLADKEAQDEFNNYFTKCEIDKEWPGMNSIPDSAIESHKITVMRTQITTPAPSLPPSIGSTSSDGSISSGESSEEPTVSPEINITYTSSVVNITEYINGTAKSIPEGQEVWIVVHPYTVNKYYPQSKVDIHNEIWSIPVGIGTKNDTGTKFNIIAVMSDTKAQEEFNNYFKVCRDTGKWPGMDKIPDSAKEYDNITVTRNPPPELTFDYNLKTAHMEETMNGTAKYLPAGQRIWIVVYPHTAYKYYPQGEAYVKNERWSLPYPVRLGDPENVSVQFDVIAALANESAQEEFRTYLENQSNNGLWMRKLPNGTEVYDRITVTRV